MNYSLALRNPYYYKKKFPIALLHFTAGFLLLNAWYESHVQTAMPILGTVFLIIAFFEVVYTFFSFRMMHRFPVVNSIVRIVTSCAFLLYAILLFQQGQTLFAVFMLVIALAFVMIFIIERRWARPFIIDINERGVLFPGTFKNPLIPWHNFNNVVLKDNILTLDLTSNRIMQLEMRAIPDKNKVQEINMFCSQRIVENQPAISGRPDNTGEGSSGQ